MLGGVDGWTGCRAGCGGLVPPGARYCPSCAADQITAGRPPSPTTRPARALLAVGVVLGVGAVCLVAALLYSALAPPTVEDERGIQRVIHTYDSRGDLDEEPTIDEQRGVRRVYTFDSY